MYKSHFLVSLCLKWTDVLPSYTLTIKGKCADKVMGLRPMALCIARKHL